MFDSFDDLPDVDAEIVVKPKAVKPKIEGKVLYKHEPKPPGQFCTTKACTQCAGAVYTCKCHWNGIQVFTYERICSNHCLDSFMLKWRDQYARQLLQCAAEDGDHRREIEIIREAVRLKDIEIDKEVAAQVDKYFKEKARKDAMSAFKSEEAPLDDDDYDLETDEDGGILADAAADEDVEPEDVDPEDEPSDDAADGFKDFDSGE